MVLKPGFTIQSQFISRMHIRMWPPIVPFSMSNTEKWAKENLSLPIYGTMDLESANEVVRRIDAYVRGEH